MIKEEFEINKDDIHLDSSFYNRDDIIQILDVFRYALEPNFRNQFCIELGRMNYE